MINTKSIAPGLALLALILSPISAEDTKNEPLGLREAMPEFAANNDRGNLWTPDDIAEDTEYVVVYFYPAAMTSGCTKQACAYRDSSETIEAENVEVIGVSGDSVNNLKNFKEQHELNFTLLSDVNGVIASEFGVPKRGGGEITREIGGKDILMRRSYTSARWTYIFDNERNLIYRNSNVNAEHDSAIALKVIKGDKQSKAAATE